MLIAQCQQAKSEAPAVARWVEMDYGKYDKQSRQVLRCEAKCLTERKRDRFKSWYFIHKTEERIIRLLYKSVFFNLFVAAEPYTSVKITHRTPCIDP